MRKNLFRTKNTTEYLPSQREPELSIDIMIEALSCAFARSTSSSSTDCVTFISSPQTTGASSAISDGLVPA